MKKVCVFLADGFEEIEGLTVVDILRRAGLEAVTASVKDEISVTGSHNITVLADKTAAEVDFDGIDMLVLPGGMPGTKNLAASELVKEKILEFHQQGKWLAAICAAPSVFGDMGLLNEERAACYPGFEEHLKGAEVTEEKVVVSGHFITSRGMGTAILFALQIVEQLLDKEKADRIKASIIYGH